MSEVNEISLFVGLRETERDVAASLYWQAFSEKLSFLLGPRKKAEVYISKVLNKDNVFVVRDPKNNIIGLSGFRDINGGVIGGTFGDLVDVYGIVGAIWRAAFLSLLERKDNSEILHLDAVCVEQKSRGKGIGRKIIDFSGRFAKSRSIVAIELDVVSNNETAIKFYKNLDFYIVSKEKIGLMGLILGFKSIYRMRLDLNKKQS